MVGLTDNSVDEGGSGERAPAISLYPTLQAAAFIMRPTEFLQRAAEQHGECFLIRIPRPLLVVSNPALARGVLEGDPAIFHGGGANAFMEPIFGSHSLLLTDGIRHSAQRGLFGPYFSGARLDGIDELLEHHTLREIRQWRSGDRVELLGRMQSITLAIIVSVLFGTRGFEGEEELIRALHKLSIAGRSRAALMPSLRKDFGPLSPWGRVVRARAAVDALLYEQIRRRRQLRVSPDGVLSSVMAEAERSGQPLSDQELRDQLVTLILASGDTTGTALAWCLYFIFRNPAVLARLRSGLAAGQTQFLDAVVRETLRARPIFPFAGRQVESKVRLGRFQVEAGTMVAPCIYLVQRHTSNPDTFLPERFLSGHAETPPWIPFGGGARRCLGSALAIRQMRVVVRTVVDEIDLYPERPKPEPIGLRAITIIPGRGAVMRVRSALKAG